jgi:hypothetical protein
MDTKPVSPKPKHTPPPRKKREEGEEPKPPQRRRLDGLVLDVSAMAEHFGDTEHGIRAKVARGTLPYRRLGGRVVFVREDVVAFLQRLPGISTDQALANLAMHREA